MTVTANVWITLGRGQAEIQSQIQIGIGNGFTFLNEISNLKKKLEFETRLTRFGRVVFALYSAFATCLVSILFLRFVLLH